MLLSRLRREHRLFRLLCSGAILLFLQPATTQALSFGTAPELNRPNIFGRVPKLSEYWPRPNDNGATLRPGIGRIPSGLDPGRISFGRVPKLSEYWPRAGAQSDQNGGSSSSPFGRVPKLSEYWPRASSQ